MGRSKHPVLSEHEREQMRRWLENWRAAGPVLERERLDGVRALTEADAARHALDLWTLGRPGGGDDAEGILPMFPLLEKLARR